MSTWDDKPNDYEHALAQIEQHRSEIERLQAECSKLIELRVSPPTASKSIVERLNDRDCALCQEAADEIERLRERCEGYKGQVKWGADEIERLRAALEPFQRNVKAISLSSALGHIGREELLAARKAYRRII